VKIANMNHQELLLKSIRKLLATDTSLNEVLASVLNISYDAAHRRVSLKSKFSIEETVLLCNHFCISMDNLFQNQQKIVVEKTEPINNMNDFKKYFEKSSSSLLPFLKQQTNLYYLAKDIPLQYTIGGTLLSKFKLFVWYNLLTQNLLTKYEDFVIDANMLNETTNIQQVFEHCERTEIWNDTTVNSTLQQIFYFFEAGLINYYNALLMLEDVKLIITNIEKKCALNDPKFQIYYNELTILNNAVLFSSASKSALFLPFNMLGYYINHDTKSCNEEKTYILKQLSNSKQLSQAGKKDQKVFFNKIIQKIDFYKSKIENYVVE
jgi:hypothetical protein